MSESKKPPSAKLPPITGVFLARELADFVTVTSSTANAVIDSASAELAKRMAKQIEKFEKERAAGRSLPNTIE